MQELRKASALIAAVFLELKIMRLDHLIVARNEHLLIQTLPATHLQYLLEIALQVALRCRVVSKHRSFVAGPGFLGLSHFWFVPYTSHSTAFEFSRT